MASTGPNLQMTPLRLREKKLKVLHRSKHPCAGHCVACWEDGQLQVMGLSSQRPSLPEGRWGQGGRT